MSQNIIGLTSTIKTPIGKTFDANQQVRVKAIAGSALVAKTFYKVTFDEFGFVTQAQADDVHVYYMGMAEKAWDSGDLAELVIGGPVEDAITPSLSVSVGHAFIMVGGAIADVGADYTGVVGQFAICTEASTSSTTQNMLLVPERITATT